MSSSLLVRGAERCPGRAIPQKDLVVLDVDESVSMAAPEQC